MIEQAEERNPLLLEMPWHLSDVWLVLALETHYCSDDDHLVPELIIR